jgi:hypothetical protein
MHLYLLNHYILFTIPKRFPLLNLFYTLYKLLC